VDAPRPARYDARYPEAPVSKVKKSVCMLCGKPAPKSICDLCAGRVQGEVLNKKKKEKERTE